MPRAHRTCQAPTGHAPCRGQRVDIEPLCPLLAAATGHVLPGSAPHSSWALQGGACPAVPGLDAPPQLLRGARVSAREIPALARVLGRSQGRQLGRSFGAGFRQWGRCPGPESAGGTCPLLGPAGGQSAHMPAPGRGDWACPVGELPGSRLGRGHVHCWGWRVDRVPICPLLAAGNGHVQWARWPGPDSGGDMSTVGAGGWTEWPYARSLPRGLGMSGGGRSASGLGVSAPGPVPPTRSAGRCGA